MSGKAAHPALKKFFHKCAINLCHFEYSMNTPSVFGSSKLRRLQSITFRDMYYNLSRIHLTQRFTATTQARASNQRWSAEPGTNFLERA